MPDSTRDPVHRVRYAFRPEGENLIVDAWIEPGGALPEHRHPQQEEHWEVLDGRICIKLDGRARTIGPADGPQIVTAGMRHALAAVEDREAQLRCHVYPARDLQAFLEESAAAAREGLFLRGGIPRSWHGARWAAAFLARHRADVVMTFPPRAVQSALIALLARAGNRPARRPACRPAPPRGRGAALPPPRCAARFAPPAAPRGNPPGAPPCMPARACSLAGIIISTPPLKGPSRVRDR